MFKGCFIAILVTACVSTLHGQSIVKEKVAFSLLEKPKHVVSGPSRTYKVIVNSPYNLTAESVVLQSKVDYEKEVENFNRKLELGKQEYQEKLDNHDKEVLLAKEKFATESAEFKKLSMIERLTLTDQGKNPKLVSPVRPVYNQAAPPVYREPNLNAYLLVNNDVLGTQIQLDGFTRDGNFLTINIDLEKVNFQDNNGQTYANQPTVLSIKENGIETVNKTLFKDFTMISSMPSNNINKPMSEKNFLNNVIKEINQIINSEYGYKTIDNVIILRSVKNKNNKYDDLEKANIYATTNFKKLNPLNEEMNQAALAGIEKAVDLWVSNLSKIDYKDKKNDYNSTVAKMLYFNLMNTYLALENKKEAEKWLNAMQENLIYIDLSSDDKDSLKEIETQIYKSK